MPPTSASAESRRRRRPLLLEVDNLDVRYGLTQAVSGVSFGVGADELVTILGANGAGKTSLLRAVQGLIPLSGGEIRFDGNVISALKPPQRLRRRLVLVPEGRQIILQLTVHENLQMGAYSRNDADVGHDINAIYDRFPNLAARRGMPAGILSGGEQQMLAIGRALLAKPKLMMLDEPSLGLSPILVEKLFELIAGLRRDGIAILLVEQNSQMALEIADRGMVLELGRVTMDGSAEILHRDERLARAYLGHASAGQR